VNEKVDAFEAGASLTAGASAADVIGRRYREYVAANARRLSEI
jgi:hypothetical protein